MRRGGLYKNGAVVLHLDYSSPDAIEFVSASRSELPWVKRCLNVDDNFLSASSRELINACLRAISSGDLWLNKIRHDNRGERIRANVCLEVYLPHRGTCLLQHVNLGACTLDNIQGAFVEGMMQLCELHPRTGVGDTGEYLPPEIDRQVGLGVLGLANFLSIHGISYKDFGDALEAYTLGTEAWDFWYETKAGDAVSALDAAISAAAEIAREHKMERAFAIAPTASCS